MENEHLITVETVSSHYKIETTFIQTLNEYGLIEITRINETEFIEKDRLGDVEKMMNLYYDLNINMEGIDAISHLLKKLKDTQKELVSLRNRLEH